MHVDDASPNAAEVVRLFCAERGCAAFEQRVLRFDAPSDERANADDDEVLYVLGGSGSATFGSERRTLAPGTAAFVSRGSRWRVDDAIHLDMQIGCVDDRMNDEMQRQPMPVDFHRHAVDQKRHVVVDDLDHGVGRAPAVLLHDGVEDAHARGSRLAPPREVPVRQRGAVKVRRLALGEILGIDLEVIRPNEGLDGAARLCGDLLPDQGEDLLEPFGLGLVGARKHARSV